LEYLFTAVIPVHSMAGKLTNLNLTLDACANLPIQVVIIHDDADDGTEEDLVRILNSFDTLHYEKYTVKYGSPGLTRNVGILRAKSDWISFWDCDDLPVPLAITSLMQSISLENFDVIIGAIATQSGTDAKTLKKHSTIGAESLRQMHLANMPAFTRMVYRRSLIGEAMFPAWRVGEDQCFLREIEFLNSRVYYAEDLFYIYISDFCGQLSRNEKFSSEIIFSLDFLSRRIWSSPLTMREFCHTQFLKMFIVTIRKAGLVRLLLISPNSLLAFLRMTLTNPIRVLRRARFLAISRPELAGRRRDLN
jgi:glycosyltransferase involved in cell wall biosynthesis